jgi:putative sigma-54 modulation protein
MLMIETIWEGITINIKATNTELTPALRDYISARVTKLGTLLQAQSGKIFVYFEIAKTTEHHNKGDIYRADASVEIAGKTFYASADKEDLLQAIDAVKEKLHKEIRRDKNKDQSLFRRGAQKIKDLVRFS